VVILIIDSLGVGELPDAEKYGDAGSNTLANTARAVGGLRLPYLGRLGLGNVIEVMGVPPDACPLAAYGKLEELSEGKDTTSGHWELAGVVLSKGFPTYPQGFPKELIARFERAIGRKSLGNKAASGTEIIKELGQEHMKTGYPIVYTSADSVFQVAAHEEVIPVEELYRICQIARDRILVGEHSVGRVIARPFAGKPGEFVRTRRRKDFSLPAPSPTLLDYASKSGLPVFAVGKIADIFGGQGITEDLHCASNAETVDCTLAKLREESRGIIFSNLVDFDMLWGHRNDFKAYAGGLEYVDGRLPEILNLLREDDALFISADHGCDPTTPSTDHSREYVPLLVYGERITAAVDLGVRRMSDMGKTVAELLGLEAEIQGESFAEEIVVEEMHQPIN
jgi:phosphopentomutase